MPAPLSITAASVAKGAGAVIDASSYAGEAVTQGQVVYQKASDNLWYLAQCDGTAAQAGTAGLKIGIALNAAAAAGQPLAVQVAGTLTIGATVASGVMYYVGAVFGNINPVADLTTGNYVTAIGYGISTTQIVVNPVITGVVL